MTPVPAPSPEPLVARDQVGATTLERMNRAEAYNRWMYDRLAPWIGRRVIEIGSGIGNMSQFLSAADRLVLTDTEPAYRAHLERRFGVEPPVSVMSLTLPTIPDSLRAERFDTVVCLNVLEHIADDRGSLAAIRRLLEPGGRLVLLVPALPSIYGTLDRQLGHERRYTPRLLRERYAEAGFRMLRLEYFNFAGVPGWWFTGRVLKSDLIPAGGLALFDALVPLFRLERFLPWRVGQSLIAIGENPG
jgi:SAM-dependent methyltransferase